MTTTTTLIVCNTCGYNQELPDAVRQGELFAQTLESALLHDDTIQLQRFGCLMACQRKCTVQLRAGGKIGYTLGDFVPDKEHVEALLEYVRLYQTSETGQVPYKQWPALVKGKFISRIPVLEGVDSSTNQD